MSRSKRSRSTRRSRGARPRRDQVPPAQRAASPAPAEIETLAPASSASSDRATTIASQTSKPRAVRWLVGVGLMGAGIATVTVLVMSALSGAAPSWWRPVRADDPATRDAAVAVENALGTELHRVRNAEPWRVALRAEDATAWLNTRLNEWLVNQSGSGQRAAGVTDSKDVFRLPDGMDEFQVQFEGDRVYIGVRLLGDAGAKPRFLSASLVPRLDDDGALWLPAEWVHIGRMPIPASWALSRADEERDVLLPEGWRQSAEADTFFAVLAGEVPVPRPARVELADGRVVRAVAVRTDDSRLAITFVTE